MRNKRYNVFTLRLDDAVIAELKRRRQNSPSWNLLIKQLLEIKHSAKPKAFKKIGNACG